MGRKCVVPYCTSGYATNTNKVSVFAVPKDKVNQWQKAIPRKDRNLTVKDVVCSKHFKETDIITKVETDSYSYDLKKPRLSNEAVPSIFPGCHVYMTKICGKRRLLERPEVVQNKIMKKKSTGTSDNKNAETSFE